MPGNNRFDRPPKARTHLFAADGELAYAAPALANKVVVTCINGAGWFTAKINGSAAVPAAALVDADVESVEVFSIARDASYTIEVASGITRLHFKNCDTTTCTLAIKAGFSTG